MRPVMTVLCLVELDEAAGLTDASLRALTSPRAGGRGPAGPVPRRRAVRARGSVPVARSAAYGVTEAYVVEPGRLDGYAPRPGRGPWRACRTAGRTAVVAAATDRGSEVLAYLGALTGQPMAANCIQPPAAAAADGTHQVVRQRWAGLLIEDASLDGLARAADRGHRGGPGHRRGGTRPAPWPCIRTRARPGPATTCGCGPPRRPAVTSGASLATARVVVGGGRGVGGPDGFAPLEELASLLGGVVGVSRVVTSEGWRPHRQQVGQTGTKITPELYLACGISGAIQHMAGCASAKHIVVVNTDAGAPILSHADYAVVGDLGEVIPALIAALRDRSA